MTKLEKKLLCALLSTHAKFLYVTQDQCNNTRFVAMQNEVKIEKIYRYDDFLKEEYLYSYKITGKDYHIKKYFEAEILAGQPQVISFYWDNWD